MTIAFVVVGGGSVAMTQSVFTGNGGGDGDTSGLAMFLDADDYTISNVLVYENEASGGWMIAGNAASGSGWIYNVVVSDNASAGGIVVSGSRVTLENSIATNNGSGIATDSSAVVRYSNAYGNDADWSYEASLQPDNMTANPRFVDPEGGDFTLDPGFSPCIDAGNPLKGYNDVDGTVNDIGAFGGPGGSGW